MLAKYKPTLNATELMSSLKTANECVTNALDYFNSTRHIVLYYEDLILNHTVSSLVTLVGSIAHCYRC